MDERNKEMMKYIQSALTIGSDEMEGQQTVDFS